MERRWVSMALGLLAGLLICVALPPWGWWPLAPVGLALWIHLLAAPKRLDRFLISWAVGVAWFGPSTLWMWNLTSPGYVLGVLFAWGPMVGAVGAVTPADRRRLLVVPAALVGFEWFHTHAPFGGVPLSMLAMSQSRAPLLPVAAVGGMLLVGLAVAALGVGLYVAVAERRWQEPLGVLLACALLVAVGSYGWSEPAIAADGEKAPPLRVVGVQGGGPQGTRFTSSQAPGVFQRHLELTRTIDEPVDLVVWPENTINISGRFVDHPWFAELQVEAARLGAPIMVGIVEDAPEDPEAFLNYVITVQPDGSIGGRYDKERRVPFGEYVPLRSLFEVIAGESLPPRDQVAGEGVAHIETAKGRLAVAISWEVFFSRRVREGVRAGGEVVINPTNGSSYWLTQVQSQQIATSALRAVESGRWLVQVAPTGFSAIIDDDGTVLERTGVSEPRLLTAKIPLMSGTTPAQALGDLPALAVAGAVALALLALHARRRRHSTALRTDAPHEPEPPTDPGAGEHARIDRVGGPPDDLRSAERPV